MNAEEKREHKRIYDRGYYARNAERIKAATKAYRQANPEKEKVWQAKIRAASKEKIRARMKLYRAKNRTRDAARLRAYRAANREAVLVNSRRWYAKARERIRQLNEKRAEKIRAARRRWEKANPDRVRLHKRLSESRRRARSSSRLPVDLPMRLFRDQSGLCAICRMPITEGRYHLDHIMPLALGGAHEESNIQLTHPVCNIAKGAKHPSSFARLNAERGRFRFMLLGMTEEGST